MEAIGLAAGVVGLAEAIFGAIKKVRDAQRRLEGRSETLNNVGGQLETLEASVKLVKTERSLQTPAVESQLQAIESVTDELRSHIEGLAACGQRRRLPQLLHRLAAGNQDDVQLQSILDRLDRATDTLHLRVSVVQVGMLGSQREGLRVALPVLAQTDARVEQVLGFNLALMKIVQNRTPRDGFVRLTNADIKALENTPGADRPLLQDGLIQSKDGLRETFIHGNITAEQAKVMTGDVGMDEQAPIARDRRRTTITDNHFGGKSRIMTGDVGGQAASRFMDNFWD